MDWTKMLADIDGILPKGPYLPCVSMAGRALLAGYPWYADEWFNKISLTEHISIVTAFLLNIFQWVFISGLVSFSLNMAITLHKWQAIIRQWWHSLSYICTSMDIKGQWIPREDETQDHSGYGLSWWEISWESINRWLCSKQTLWSYGHVSRIYRWLGARLQ